MSDPFVAEIRIFPFNFAPRGWAQCNGQILPIAQNVALFSLLGTSYGGNGTSNFGLPNLQGAVPVGQGQLAGGNFYQLGETGGEATHTLLTSEMTSHNHLLVAVENTLATAGDPSGAIYAEGHWVVGTAKGQVVAYTAQAPTTQMASNSISTVGGGQAHNNLMPYLSFNFCIALQGVYPPRS